MFFFIEFCFVCVLYKNLCDCLGLFSFPPSLSCFYNKLGRVILPVLHHLLPRRQVTRNGLINITCYVLQCYILWRETVVKDLNEILENLVLQPLKPLKASPYDNAVATYHEEFSPVKGHDHLIIWSWKITWQT